MKTLKTILLWLLICGCVAIIFRAGMSVGYDWYEFDNPPLEPTVRAIQISLTLDGYPCGDIDGDPGPLFRAAYNRREGDRYAVESYARMPEE